MATTGPIALITGGGGYLANGIAKAMVADGWRLVLHDLDRSAADRVAEGLDGAVLETVACDVCDYDAVQELVQGVIARHGPIHGLVLAAGGGKSLGPRKVFWETELENWTLTVTTQLNGVMNFCHALLPHMRENKQGAIVSVASGHGLPGGPPITRSHLADVYGAAKAGVIAFTKSIALEYAPDNIRVNCIAPGRSGSNRRTSEELELAAAEDDAKNPGSSRISPLGRFGRPEDMGHAAAFLMSERASYITGSCIDVSGGMRRH